MSGFGVSPDCGDTGSRVLGAQESTETALAALEGSLHDAIETAMWAHESVDRGSRCSCGVRNNMDGDVLDTHRVGAVAAAAWSVIQALGLQPEWGVITDMGITSPHPKKGMTSERAEEMAAKYDDITARTRWVSSWQATDA